MSTIMKNDILETIMSAPQYSTLARMLKAAELTEVLQEDGPMTFFAPINDAFKDLPIDNLETVLANQQMLQAVLKNHIVEGKYMSGDVVCMDSLNTIDGGTLNITLGNGCQVNHANICDADILCSNGVIHIIDAVLLPE